mmetsp:Transcript_22319/g.15914  ORF Transcript_22319/g.15914 Transcript_22319/m.15914 type:complete len:118 (+) Transcript_22319:234-587(+)
MLNSSAKIKSSASKLAIAKLKEDTDAIEQRYANFMSPRILKQGIEVLEDLVSFFECSPAFISVPCEKLRRTQGKQFKYKIAQALMGLRSDLDKSNKNQCLAICKDIIENYKEDNLNA